MKYKLYPILDKGTNVNMRIYGQMKPPQNEVNLCDYILFVITYCDNILNFVRKQFITKYVL